MDSVMIAAIILASAALLFAIISLFTSYRYVVNVTENVVEVAPNDEKGVFQELNVTSYAPIRHVGQIVLSVPAGKDQVYSSTTGAAIDLEAAMTRLVAAGEANEFRSMGPGTVAGQVHHLVFDNQEDENWHILLKIKNAEGFPPETIAFTHRGQSHTLMWDGNQWMRIAFDGSNPEVV